MPRRHPAKKGRVSETVARPTRTSVMYAVAVAIVAFWNAHVAHLDKTGKAVALGIALALTNAVWVAVENRLEVGILRDVPPKKVAVVDGNNRGEYGYGALEIVAVVAVVVILLVVLTRL
jgi:hypothetical protein